MRNIRLILFTLLVVLMGATVVYLVTRLAEAATIPAFAQAKHAPKQTTRESDAPEDVDEMFNDGVIRFGQGDNPREYILQCLNTDTTIKGAPVDGAIVVSCGHK